MSRRPTNNGTFVPSLHSPESRSRERPMSEGEKQHRELQHATQKKQNARENTNAYWQYSTFRNLQFNRREHEQKLKECHRRDKYREERNRSNDSSTSNRNRLMNKFPSPFRLKEDPQPSAPTKETLFEYPYRTNTFPNRPPNPYGASSSQYHRQPVKQDPALSRRDTTSFRSSPGLAKSGTSYSTSSFGSGRSTPPMSLEQLEDEEWAEDLKD